MFLNKIRICFLLVFLLFFLAGFSYAQDEGPRFGGGLKLGLPAYIWHVAGYSLGYTHNNQYQFDLYLSPWYDKDDNNFSFALFSAYISKIIESDDDGRAYVGLGLAGSYVPDKKQINIISPAAKICAEGGPYRGLNFMVEFGYPLIIGVGAKWYL